MPLYAIGCRITRTEVRTIMADSESEACEQLRRKILAWQGADNVEVVSCRQLETDAGIIDG